MNWLSKLDELLESKLNTVSYNYWTEMIKELPNIWDRPTSSTLKYHKREDGSVPSIAEHTYEMVWAASKILRLFPHGKVKSDKSDTILLATALHDGLKYGTTGKQPHTTSKHDQLMADTIGYRGSVLSEMIRYHSGQWSTDVTKPFHWQEHHPEVLFLHILDMLSAADCLKIPKEADDATTN